MSVPKVVVFDLGKVLLDFDYRIAVRRLIGQSKVTAEELRQIIDQSALLLQYESGTISTAQFFEKVRAASGFRGEMEEFVEIFGDIFSPIPAMLRLHAELRSHQILTYVFSNTNDLAIKHIRGHYPFFKNFDGYVLSYEHGALKPEPKIYSIVEELTRCCGEEILYLDDRPENVAAGSERGWRTVCHTSPEASRAQIAAHGLLPQAPQAAG